MGVERKSNGTYQARYRKDGVRINVGTFKSKSEARRHLVLAREQGIVGVETEAGKIYLSKNSSDSNFINSNGGYTPIKPTLKQRFTTWLKSLRAS